MSGKQIDLGKNTASIQLLHLGFLHVCASDTRSFRVLSRAVSRWLE